MNEQKLKERKNVGALLVRNTRKNLPNCAPKGSKGITLVALIITIIVLLILAVVAIRAVQGDGIIQQAKNAQTRYETEQTNEQTTLEGYLGKIEANIPGASQTPGPTMQVKHGTGDFADLTSIGSVYYGDIVSIAKGEGTEQFYVIGSKSASETKIATASEISGANTAVTSGHTKLILLAMYNLKADGSEQDTTGANNECAFSSTNYWCRVSGIEYPYTSGENAGKYPDLNDEDTYPLGTATSDVKTRLQAYSTSLGIDTRLMTVEEVVGLGGDATTNATTSGCPNFINSVNSHNLNYWLGSANDDNFVWIVRGDYSGLYGDDCNLGSYGVRPVVEVSIS